MANRMLSPKELKTLREDASTLEQPAMALCSDVRIRTYLVRNRTLALGNFRAKLNKIRPYKTLRAAFRLQVGMSVVQHAS